MAIDLMPWFEAEWDNRYETQCEPFPKLLGQIVPLQVEPWVVLPSLNHFPGEVAAILTSISLSAHAQTNAQCIVHMYSLDGDVFVAFEKGNKR